MNLLTTLLKEGGDDLSRLPKDVVTSIKSNIRKGAEDLEQKWPNALGLVHKAYEVEGVQRPTPDMKSAWKQYEEHLVYAVQQLADNRGMDDDWRMSSSIFREAHIPQQQFLVRIDNDERLVEGKDIDEVINTLSEQLNHMDVQKIKKGEQLELNFSKWGVKHRTKVTVEPIR